MFLQTLEEKYVTYTVILYINFVTDIPSLKHFYYYSTMCPTVETQTSKVSCKFSRSFVQLR